MFDETKDVWVRNAGELEQRWRADGSLLEEVSFNNGKPALERHYHPDGTLGFERTYDPKTFLPTAQTRIASKGKTDLRFPRKGMPAGVHKAHYTYDRHGYLTAFTGWDDAGKLITEEKIQRSLDGQVQQTEYTSIEEASAEWQAKNRAYYAALNDFVEAIHQDDPPDGLEPPEDERGHMERYVLGVVERFNEAGRGHELREYFAPSFEPLCTNIWEQFGKRINALALLGDRLLINAGDKVYSVTEREIVAEEGLLRFGLSKNRKLLAKGYADRIDVVDIASGQVLRSFAVPKADGVEPGLAALEVKALVVPNSGAFVVVAALAGIWMVRAHAATLVMPSKDMLEADDDAKQEREATGRWPRLVNPQAALREDDKVLVVSGELSFESTRLSFEISDGLELTQTQHDTHGSGFGPSCYHSSGTHYMLSITVDDDGESSLLPLRRTFVDGQKGELLDGDAVNAELKGRVMMRTTNIGALAEYKDRFIVGMSDCYVYLQPLDRNSRELFYVGCGGSSTDFEFEVSAIDVTPDGQEIVVGLNAGIVWRLVASDRLPHETMLSNQKVADKERYLFLDTFVPMRW